MLQPTEPHRPGPLLPFSFLFLNEDIEESSEFLNKWESWNTNPQFSVPKPKHFPTCHTISWSLESVEVYKTNNFKWSLAVEYKYRSACRVERPPHFPSCLEFTVEATSLCLYRDRQFGYVTSIHCLLWTLSALYQGSKNETDKITVLWMWHHKIIYFDWCMCMCI